VTFDVGRARRWYDQTTVEAPQAGGIKAWYRPGAVLKCGPNAYADSWRNKSLETASRLDGSSSQFSEMNCAKPELLALRANLRLESVHNVAM